MRVALNVIQGRRNKRPLYLPMDFSRFIFLFLILLIVIFLNNKKSPKSRHGGTKDSFNSTQVFADIFLNRRDRKN